MRLRTTLPVLAVALLCALLCPSPQTGAQESPNGLSGWGIVLLHGSQASPGEFGILGGPLKAHGAVVVTPLMAWGRSRMYDAGFAHEAAIIDAALDGLRARGFTKVALGGQSHGGGVALTYAGLRRRRLDALLIMAPGPSDTPPEIVEEGRRATRLISEGQGDVPMVFLDNNAGRTTTTNFYVTATPKIYLQWHTMSSPTWVDRAKAARVPGNVPVLWISPLRDSNFAQQRAAASSLPKNPRSRYVELDTYHIDVPNEAVSTVLEWFESLNH